MGCRGLFKIQQRVRFSCPYYSAKAIPKRYNHRTYAEPAPACHVDRRVRIIIGYPAITWSRGMRMNNKQLARWQRIRAGGRSRYIRRHGILGWGLTSAVLICAIQWWTEPAPRLPRLAISFVIFPLTSGRMWWWMGICEVRRHLAHQPPAVECRVRARRRNPIRGLVFRRAPRCERRAVRGVQAVRRDRPGRCRDRANSPLELMLDCGCDARRETEAVATVARPVAVGCYLPFLPELLAARISSGH